MTTDDLIRALVAALESGIEVTVSLKKPGKETSAENTVTCPHCNWTHSYSRADNARRGLRAHSKHCTRRKEGSAPVPPQWLKDQVEGRSL